MRHTHAAWPRNFPAPPRVGLFTLCLCSTRRLSLLPLAKLKQFPLCLTSTCLTSTFPVPSLTSMHTPPHEYHPPTLPTYAERKREKERLLAVAAGRDVDAVDGIAGVYPPPSCPSCLAYNGILTLCSCRRSWSLAECAATVSHASSRFALLRLGARHSLLGLI